MKIYTRTGDSGETSYIGGRISKASDMIDLIGELDEINSSLGVVIAGMKRQKKKAVKNMLEHMVTIQSQLFNLGALVARPNLSGQEAIQEIKLIEAWVEDLEYLIDGWDVELQSLQNFILPGGTEAGAYLHHARTVARRAERTAVRLIKGLTIQPESQASYQENLKIVQKYLNRLSDTLFTAARYANSLLGHPEEIWSGKNEQMRLEL